MLAFAHHAPARPSTTSCSSEIRNPRRHEDRLGRPDRDGRRRGAARRRVSPARRGPISGDPELRALRQGARLPGGLQERLDAHDQGLSRNGAGLEQQVPELGAGRPGEMGAGRLRHRAGRFARRRPLARPSRRLVAARGEGPLRLRRVGRHAALVERQGRHQRHFLLRHEPVARGAASARRISPRCASGKARPTTTASSRATAASSATSWRAGRAGRWRACSTASASAGRRAR